MKLVGAKFKIAGKEAGEVRLGADGSAMIAVRDPMIRMELTSGVLGPGKKRVTKESGLEFIQAVIRQYSGAYVQAIGIIE